MFIAGGFIVGTLAYTSEKGDNIIEKINTNEINNAMLLLCLFIASLLSIYLNKNYYKFHYMSNLRKKLLDYCKEL
ncbi:MAG TPA: hypothetical protein DHV55_07385 [Clostridiaceae bacterium]|nr:hypothetical protein [Clostridiaceae bacterium]